MKKTILIPGGAGYIGSHTAYLLAQQGYHVIILDNFVHNQQFDPDWCTVIRGDFADQAVLKDVFTTYDIDCVMHFAAFIEVGESVKYPQKFYANNVVKTLTLLNMMIEHGIKKIIFSSSCAVYGEPVRIPMDETNPYNPISTYGKNKLAVEFALQDYDTAYGLKHVSLRYFNASGAITKAGLGEQHDPETHIIPLMIRAIKERKPFKVFGTDYDTPDGTCIRDYIHVQDLGNAHILALNYLDATQTSNAFNLGSGKGFSVQEMIDTTQKICGTSMTIEHCARRAGDPAILLADYTKAKQTLGWKPTYSDITSILRSAITSYETFFPTRVCRSATSSAGRAHK